MRALPPSNHSLAVPTDLIQPIDSTQRKQIGAISLIRNILTNILKIPIVLIAVAEGIPMHQVS
jgi:hypothetical protein